VSQKPPPRPPRTEPREIVELRRLRSEQPDLASAVDLQIALIELQRRVQARVPLPWAEIDAARFTAQQAGGRPILRFEDIPLNWTDFRLMFRETADLLRRFDAIEPEDYQQAQALAREGHALEPLVEAWYKASSGTVPVPVETPPITEGLGNILVLASRPFLARCAEVLTQRLDLSGWRRGRCPVCGAEPEFAVITPAAERLLICSRCTARWPHDSFACPFCGNDDRRRITSLASRDGQYRIYACDQCQRYLKAFDARRASRPVMVPVDSIATLPLDAAAMQRGYHS
jgi:FdhE protein